MREGSRTDRSLSTFAIVTTATPEYVSGVILISVFASSAFGLKWFKGTATSAMENPNFENFLLPVLTIAIYGMGYIARMTRASMAEVMTAQYIRTARLEGRFIFKYRSQTCTKKCLDSSVHSDNVTISLAPKWGSYR
jgi:peptide/nickel transport system permease protein